MGDPTTPASGYLRYLPAVLQAGPFIEPFLLGFEAILTGYLPPPDGKPAPVGLEAMLDCIPSYFDPRAAPPDFLPWLAQWVALGLRDDWSVATRRRLIAAMVPLYHLRGTKSGILAALTLCLEGRNATASLDEPVAPGAAPTAFVPHYFEILLTVTDRQGSEELETTKKIVESVANQQKPAHTYYKLLISYPMLQILDAPVAGDTDRVYGAYVGVTTILGSRSVDATPAETPPPAQGDLSS